MENLKFDDINSKVSFVCPNGVLRKGHILTFPFNNRVDVEEEGTGSVFYNIPAECIKKQRT